MPSTSSPVDSLPAQDLIQTLTEVSLSAIHILRPVFAEGNPSILDFKIEYLSPEGLRMLRQSSPLTGTVLENFPHLEETGVLDFYRSTFFSNQAERFTVNYQYDGLENFFHLAAKRQGDVLVVSFTDTGNQERSIVENALREAQAREKAALAEIDLQWQQLHNVFMQTPAMICIFEGPDHVFKLVNPTYQALVGDRPLLGRPIREAMPELVSQPIFSLLDKVYQTGESFYAHEMVVRLHHSSNPGNLNHNFYNFIYQATRNLNNQIDGILVFAFDVTAQVQAKQQVQNVNSLLEAKVHERTSALQIAQAEADRQKQQLERLFMNAPAAICILGGPELVYELVNPAYQELFPGRDLLGKPILDALPEIEHNQVYATFKEVYETGRTHEEQELLIPLVRPSDGVLENRYFQYIQQARQDDQGNINGVLVFAFEVTSQVMARKASEVAAQQLQLITDSLPVLIGYLDREEKYRFANQAYESWFNQKPEQLIGRRVQDIVGDVAYQQVKTHIDRALAGERVDFETFMPYRKDFLKHIRSSYVPDMRNGEVLGFYTLIHDISEEVASQEALKESERQAKSLALDLACANEELQQANQQLTYTNIDLDNFIYTASHDLKAPILNIEGLMDVLLDELPPTESRSDNLQQILLLILASIQRFKRTIDHLTEITKLQKENSPKSAVIHLPDVMDAVLLDVQPAIVSTQAQLTIALENCDSIHFSEKNLRSILYNLLSNALKYRSLDRKPIIQVRCHAIPNYQVLTVQDNGLGISEAQLPHIFEMFKRLHDHVEGSGVGLYMVKRIIENAGGHIEVESQLGQGSTFKVFFRNS